jgi:aspartyl-tRNA(Asn)/glutamyl-tRNA(Gln) amidotransferase subunit C
LWGIRFSFVVTVAWIAAIVRKNEMSMDRRAIEHLEALARLELNEEERVKLAAELGRIVEFVEKLQSVDTTGVEAERHGDHLDAEHLRDDEPRPGLDRDHVLHQAPDATDGFLRVPRVIERDDGS